MGSMKTMALKRKLNLTLNQAINAAKDRNWPRHKLLRARTSKLMMELKMSIMADDRKKK